MAKSSTPQKASYDFVIVGSGFGGSVSALRLVEKGYSVLLIERGKRFSLSDFPSSNWELSKYLWAPFLGWLGPQSLKFLRGLMVLHGSGVGGGSLIYANTLRQPKEEIFENGWPTSENWANTLRESFVKAKEMLGVVSAADHLRAADNVLKEVSRQFSCESTFEAADVGVFFGEPGVKVADPYFRGKGPERIGCTLCGACMVGCKVGAKNTLEQNYLYLAEAQGLEIAWPLSVEKMSTSETGYEVFFKETGKHFSALRSVKAQHVVLSAGVLGTVELLLRCRDYYQTLSNISQTLGQTVRTNGESLLGVIREGDGYHFSDGVAIASHIQLNEVTSVETVRYPKGSGAMFLLAVPLVSAKNWATRILKLIVIGLFRLPKWIRLWTRSDIANRSVILLVMQTVDQKMGLRLGAWTRRLTGKIEGKKIPPQNDLAQRLACGLGEIIDGEPMNVVTEIVANMTSTAHILGGAVLADSPENGVIDHHHEVFGHPGLFVCDGSVIPVNLGVNPSLTITALAERFANQFPSRSVSG